MQWIIEDIRRDRAESGHAWGDVALLYRKHEIGEGLEAAFLNAGLPVRLADVAKQNVKAWMKTPKGRAAVGGTTLLITLLIAARVRAVRHRTY